MISTVGMFLLLAPIFAFAETCPDKPGGTNTINKDPVTFEHNRGSLQNSDLCTVRITTPADYRRFFTFNSRGDITVNVMSEDKKVVTTCQYRILPTGTEATGTLRDGTVKSAGLEWRFDPSRGGRLVSNVNDCTFTYEPGGGEASNCGFKIVGCRGKVIMAWDPSVLKSSKDKTKASIPTENVTILDPGGKKCVLKNDDVLKYQQVAVDAAHPLCGPGVPVGQCTEKDPATGGAALDQMPLNRSAGELHSILSSKCAKENLRLNALLGAKNTGTGEGSDASR